MMNRLLIFWCFCTFVFTACHKTEATDSTPAPPSPPPTPPPPTTSATDSLNGWQKINTQTDGYFFDVAFPTAANGFLAGGDIFYRSTDSGKTWTKDLTLITHPVTINFLNPQYGYAVGDGEVTVTTNGGATWRKKSFSPAADVWFVTPSTGYLAGERLARTTDTGSTWLPLIQRTHIQSVFFLNEQQGWCGGKDSLYQTQNGGASWAGRKVTDDEIKTIWFSNASAGWFTADSSVYRTTDGGNSWAKTNLGALAFDLQFLNTQTGYASVTGGVFKTTDGGLTWKKNLTATLNYFPELFFLDENTGWVTGDKGILYRWKK